MKKIFLIMVFMLVSTWASAKKVEIEFWFSSSFNAKQSIDEMIGEYNRMQSETRVKAVFQGLYEEMEVKMLAAAATGQLPDVAQQKFEYMDLYIAEGLLAPIDELISKSERDDILRELWDAVSRDGKIYGVPFAVNTTIFFYNEDIFREAGLGPGAVPGTWEEVIRLGKELTVDSDGDGRADRYAMVMWQNGFNSFAPFAWSNGGDLFAGDGKRVDLTSKEMRDSISMLRDLIYVHRIMPSGWTDAEGA